MPDPETFEHTFTGDGAIIGKEVILEVKFHSRPEPTGYLWYPYDLSEAIANTTTVGRYTAEDLTAVLLYRHNNVIL